MTRTDDAVETVLAVPDLERVFLRNVHLKRDCILDYTCFGGVGDYSGTSTQFQLQEGGVGLLETMRHQILNPAYAFLFAHQTSLGDEKVSDEAIHLAAAVLDVGYRGVWKKRLRRARGIT